MSHMRTSDTKARRQNCLWQKRAKQTRKQGGMVLRRIWKVLIYCGKYKCRKKINGATGWLRCTSPGVFTWTIAVKLVSDHALLLHLYKLSWLLHNSDAMQFVLCVVRCSWMIEETYAKLQLKLAAKIATSYVSKG